MKPTWDISTSLNECIKKILRAQKCKQKFFVILFLILSFRGFYAIDEVLKLLYTGVCIYLLDPFLEWQLTYKYSI